VCVCVCVCVCVFHGLWSDEAPRLWQQINPQQWLSKIKY